MRHKYDTRGIVLARQSLGEQSTTLTLLTRDLGIVRARAQSVRRPGAKLAHALATFAESDVVLVRGREGWRVSGALLGENWARRMSREARERASRVTGLLLRFAPGEAQETALFSVMTGFFFALCETPPEEQEPVEVLAALRFLAVLGLDAGEIPGESNFNSAAFAQIRSDRSGYIARINRGIDASGL